jgi:hypothetical protein
LVFLYVVGGLLLAAGIVVFIWLKWRLLGAALAASGVAILAVAKLLNTHPWVVYVLLGAIFVTMLVAVLGTAKVRNIWKALKTVVAGVEEAEGAASLEVKSSIANVGGEASRPVIREAKADAGF